MSIQDWIPAISTTGLLAGVLWLCRSLITTRLTASVGHKFDRKLEAVRTSHRNSEEKFKADLRAKENEIALLRSGALLGLASRQAALDKRRIEAVDQLWSAIIDLGPAKSVSASMAALKFESASKIAAENPEARQVFSVLGGNLDPKSVFSRTADEARPFITPIAWAFFSAYQAIISVALIRAKVLQSGLDMPDMVDTERVEKLIAVALPHQVPLIEKYGASAYHHLLEELETRLLQELQNMLLGVESDKATIEQAAAILKESEQMMKSISESEASGEQEN